MPIKQHQHGFTMIEVLIAAVVLGVGLLGLAALQAQSLQFSYSAYQRSQATLLAYDIIDRIRANPSVTSINSYAHALDDGPPGQDCQTTDSTCTTDEMAAFDLTQWTCSLGKWNDDTNCPAINGPLADGDGSVTLNNLGVDANGNTRYRITVAITWLDNRTANITGGASSEVQRETFTVNTVMSTTP